jgi:hypothetical protein
MCETKDLEKIKTHILGSITFFLFFFLFRKACRLLDNMEKYFRAGQVTDDEMAHAHCMLDI